MKWYENGIMFEGTPEEFCALHPEAAAGNAGSGMGRAITIFPVALEGAEAKKTRKRRKFQRVSIKAELAGGGTRYFRSIRAAYDWYAKASPERKLRNYQAFKKEMQENGRIVFADAELTIAKMEEEGV